MALDYGTGGNYSVRMAGPFAGGGGTAAKLTTVTLPKDAWKGGESPYSQVVEVEGVSVNSMVNPHPSVEQLHGKRIAFTIENDGGVVTVFASGDKPVEDYTFQVSIVEVVVV